MNKCCSDVSVSQVVMDSAELGVTSRGGLQNEEIKAIKKEEPEHDDFLCVFTLTL